MPILRSREIIFETSIDKTLTLEKAKEPPLDPPTPAKSDAMAAAAASPSSASGSAAAPCRRSLRLQSISPSVAETVTSRKRKSRVSQSPDVGEVRVLGESRSLSLRSSTRIAKREANVEVDLDERLDFEAVVGGESRSEENGKVIKAEEAKMNLRLGTKIAKVRAKAGEKENVEIDLQEWLDLEASVDEEKWKSVDEPQLLDTMAVKTKEAVVPERLSYEAKGKAKLVSDVDCVEKMEEGMDIDTEDDGKGKLVVEEDCPLINNDKVVYDDIEPHAQEVSEPRRGRNAKPRMTAESRKEAERNKALELATKYAFFKAEEEASEEEEEEEEEEENLSGNGDKEEDWPGPFSTAMNIIQDREEMLAARELNSSSKKNDDTGVKIHWTPSKVPKVTHRLVPSLLDLCMRVLCENADEIESLDGVPDVLKHQFITHLCQSRKMDSRALGLLVSGSPTEIHLSDCSWATEMEFQEAFCACNSEKLKVVELDISGRCFPDYVLQGTLARSPNSLPLLTKLSLKGNYRLSDDGLKAIVSSAPMLSSVNLSECSLITSAGIIGLVEKLESVLRELYIDDCQDVDAMLIIPALMKLKHLEVLSVAGIESISDKFVKKLVSVCGSNIKELVFSGCRKLGTASMKVIGESCSQLYSLDLRNLNKLNDSAIGHLANGCRSIQKLKLRRNSFSDEAVAAFVEASGGSLIELSVNNVEKVAQQTAIAISRRCSSTLKILDLSFCRNMTDEALGLIVDSCTSLRTLKLFGCTQVTNLFLEGHSNPIVKIVGSTGSVLDHIQVPDFL